MNESGQDNVSSSVPQSRVWLVYERCVLVMLMFVSARVMSSIAHIVDRVLSSYIRRSLLSLVLVVDVECNAQTVARWCW
jgi:hypothetical protein